MDNFRKLMSASYLLCSPLSRGPPEWEAWWRCRGGCQRWRGWRWRCSSWLTSPCLSGTQSQWQSFRWSRGWWRCCRERWDCCGHQVQDCKSKDQFVLSERLTKGSRQKKIKKIGDLKATFVTVTLPVNLNFGDLPILMGQVPQKKKIFFGPPNYIVPWIFRHKIVFLFVENLCQDCPVEIHHSKNIRHLIGQIGAGKTMFSFSEPHVSSDGSATNSMKPTVHNWAYLAAVSEPPRS